MKRPAPDRVMGALFLLAFVLYGAGSALAGSDSTKVAAVGIVLVVGNSAAVAAIGMLAVGMFTRARAGARTYLVARVVEAVVLACGLLPAVDDDRSFWAAMLALGVGSVPFCLILKRRRLVPGRVAILGLIGYPLLAIGAVLELSGLPVGYWFFIPGGIFEVVLGVLLVLRGLRGTSLSAGEISPDLLTDSTLPQRRPGRAC